VTVYDYSWARPDPAVLDEGVIRYVCTGSQRGKRLEVDELGRLHAAGKPVGLVFENTADASTWDGAEAVRLRAALGFPEHRPIYFAQDQNVAESDYQRIADLLNATGVPVEQRGLYAGAPLVQWCIDNGAAAWGWIAGALSWSMAPPYSVERAVAMAPSAHLIQLVGTDVPGTDMNTVLKADWGGWHPDQPQEDPMPTADEVADAVMRKINAPAEQGGGASFGTTSLGGTLQRVDHNVAVLLSVGGQTTDVAALADALAARLGKVDAKTLLDELAARLKD
jgi:hypothetical protein